MKNSLEFLLFVFSVLYSHWTWSADFKQITGIEQHEIEKCQISEDCVVTYSFIGCCKNIPVNKKYQNLVEKNRKNLWSKLTPNDEQKHCSLVECNEPEQKAICEKNKCKLVDLK